MVNRSANTQTFTNTASDRSQSILEVQNNRTIAAGETFTLAFTADNFNNITAYGLGFYIDSERLALGKHRGGGPPLFLSKISAPLVSTKRSCVLFGWMRKEWGKSFQ